MTDPVVGDWVRVILLPSLTAGREGEIVHVHTSSGLPYYEVDLGDRVYMLHISHFKVIPNEGPFGEDYYA